jgi:hypothetical protein
MPCELLVNAGSPAMSRLGYAVGAVVIAASVPGRADPAEPGSGPGRTRIGPAWPAYTAPSSRTAAHAQLADLLAGIRLAGIRADRP